MGNKTAFPPPRTTTVGTAESDSLLESLLGPMLRSAIAMVNEGAAERAAVDVAMRLGAGHALGPFELLRAFDTETAQALVGNSRRALPSIEEAAPAERPSAGEGSARRDAPAGIVGSGFMASGIAQAIAASGQPVIVVGRTQSAAEKALGRIGTATARATARGRLTADQAAELRSRVRATAELAELRSARLVIEAVVEDLAVKRAVFARLDQELPRAALLATNTSSLKVSDVAAETLAPERVIGLHFFSPAPAMKLVEVVGTPAVAERDLREVQGWVHGLGKVPVRCADRNGFIVNRLLIPLLNDSVRATERGRGSIVEIDELMKTRAGHPMGPFELLDLIGLDVALAAQRSLFEATGEERLRPARLLAEHVSQGRLGRKTGQGFHMYTAH